VAKSSIDAPRVSAPLPTAADTPARLMVSGEHFEIETRRRIEIVDLTDRLVACVQGPAGRPGLHEGTLSLWSLHTTCGLFVNEAQPALLDDIRRFIEELAARDRYYRHNDPAHSDCDRRNADAHLRALVLGHALTLQVSGGQLVLGRWQRVLLAELDGPRTRAFRVQLMGLAHHG
jgi:secondary thiamine-phosphate synthase enzyme